MEKEILLPKISDNISSVTVTEILVEVGDTVEMEDSLITVESEKASLEVPTEFAGVVKNILVKVDDDVKIGAPIVIIDTDADSASAKQTDVPKEAPKQETNEEVVVEEKMEAQPAKVEQPTTQPIHPTGDTADKNIPVSPLARMIAREMNVNLQALAAENVGSRITVSDVKNYIARSSGGIASNSNVEAIPVPDFSQWGEVNRKKLSSINKISAKNTAFSWATMPHVTHFDQADITDLEAFRKKYNAKNKSGITITSILLKMMGIALKKFPKFNASLDAANEELVYKNYYHIGVAADTKDGLLMPVIQNVNEKGIADLSDELGAMAEKARNRKLLPDQMQGQTFVISNLGGIGGIGFSPIVFPNNSAILGVSRASVQPIWDKATQDFKPRLICPLSLSYDHRVIDGADAARFMKFICQGLEQPIQLLF